MSGLSIQLLGLLLCSRYGEMGATSQLLMLTSKHGQRSQLFEIVEDQFFLRLNPP
jgi:hypothetical protein